MHRCPWCGAPCACDENDDGALDCGHDCGSDDYDEDEDEEK